MFEVTEPWKSRFPGAVVGALVVSGLDNSGSSPALNARKRQLEERLRSEWSGRDARELKLHGPIPCYSSYLKRFNKTYQLQLQMESVAIKGKDIPRVNPVVESMFMAEMSTLLLTGGHDMAAVQGLVKVKVAEGGERFFRMDGQEFLLKSGDMFMADDEGILSSFVYGTDSRTRIGPTTTRAMFGVYAPAGIGREAVLAHLMEIRDNALLVSPDARVELMEAYEA